MYQVEAAWGDQRLSVSIVLPRWSHWLGRMGTRHGSWRDTNVTKAHRKRSSVRRRFESVPGRYQPGEDGKEERTGGDEEAGQRRQEWSDEVYPIEEASGGDAENAAPVPAALSCSLERLRSAEWLGPRGTAHYPPATICSGPSVLAAARLPPTVAMTTIS